MQPEPIQLIRESFSRTPLLLPGANEGKNCAWLIPRNSAGTSMLGSTQHYPLMPADLAKIYNYMYFANGVTSAHGYQINPWWRWITITDGSWDPSAPDSNFRLNQQYLYVGGVFTYTITNIMNIPIDVKAFKVVARRDLDGYTYTQNIINEYAEALWQAGVGTETTHPLTDANFATYFTENSLDLFDAPNILRNWKIKKTTTFSLQPGKTRTFRIKLRVRKWWMRRWFNDIISNEGASIDDCPWVRLKGTPEWLFKFTPSQTAANASNVLYSSNAPVYNTNSVEPPAAAAIHYHAKYEVKGCPIPQMQFTAYLERTGQAATDTSTVKVMIDDDDKAGSIVYS